MGEGSSHAYRIFKELLGKTPLEYVRAIRLTNSAKNLLEGKDNILDIAIESQFDTHEGFTRAFSNEFGIAIENVYGAAGNYNPKLYGYEYAV